MVLLTDENEKHALRLARQAFDERGYIPHLEGRALALFGIDAQQLERNWTETYYR